MSALPQWSRDSDGRYYYWLNEASCYVYSTGHRYYPSNNTFVAPPAQQQAHPQQRSGAPETPRTSSSQPVTSDTATGSAPALTGYPSPSDERERPYITRQRQQSSSSGGSSARGNVSQYGVTQSQPPPPPRSGGQPTWQGTVVASSSYSNRATTFQASQPINPGHAPTRRDWQPDASAATLAPGPSTQGTVRPIHREIQSTPGEYEKLDPRYQRRKHDFFKRFRVFKMHWAQPADEGGSTDRTVVTDRPGEPLPKEYQKLLPQDVVRDRRFGQYIFSKIRWFIVVKEGNDKCLCVPIVTYQGKGVKKNVAKDEHAIVYTTNDAPKPNPEERAKRGEKQMRSPIRVQTDDKGDKLAEMSRIDYGRVYTVEHNIKAMAFGWVHDHSRKDFQFDFLNVFMGEQGYANWVQRQQQQQAEAADDSEDSDDDDSDDADDDE